MRSILPVFYAWLLSVGCSGNGELDLGARDASDARTIGSDVGALDAFTPDSAAADGASVADARVRDAAEDGSMVGTPGCGEASRVSDGEVTFMHEGRARRYLIYLPQNYEAEQPWPLLFALHGNGGDVSYWNSTDGDRNLRGEVHAEAILVIAEAIEGKWRDYGADQSTWPARIEEELGYFDTIVADLSDKLCIDRQAVFTMGFSGGGSFSGVLGCRREYIRAIGAGGMVIYFDPEECVQAPAAWLTMGEMELAQRGTSFRDYFLGAAMCSEETVFTDPSPCVSYSGCSVGSPVDYCVHPGNHEWPNFGTTAAWSFFKQLVE